MQYLSEQAPEVKKLFEVFAVRAVVSAVKFEVVAGFVLVEYKLAAVMVVELDIGLSVISILVCIIYAAYSRPITSCMFWFG